jgi:hypothetical protein
MMRLPASLLQACADRILYLNNRTNQLGKFLPLVEAAAVNKGYLHAPTAAPRLR